MQATDAAPRPTTAIVPSALIDLYAMRRIEKDLDPWERVCLLFFLIEDYRTGYDTVVGLANEDHVVSKYLQANVVKDWEAKIIETLSLLQNNEVLYNLGITPSVAHTTYLSRVPDFAYKVDERAKAFYQMFEDLSKIDTLRLLDKVYRDIPKPDSQSWLVADSLELHLLWWIKKDLITIHKEKWTLRKLLKILKEINMSENRHYQLLERHNEETNNYDCCYDDQLRSIINQDKTPSVRGDQDVTGDDETEKIYRIENGLVIVFNQMKFSGPVHYEYRSGSEMDCRRIKQIFENIFGFKYKEFTNAGREKLYSELENLEKDYDCVVVFILSHGELNNIVASDGEKCPISVIRSKLCSQALTGIPKVLVIQACQRAGDQKSCLTVDGSTNAPNNVDRQRDLLIFNSTIPGEVSVRDPRAGTWFIQTLCDYLPNMSVEPIFDFEDVALQVCRYFNTKEARIGGELIKQTAERQSTLTKKIIFPKKSRRAPSG